MKMRLRLTSRDFLLLLGIVVATLILLTTLFYRDALVTSSPQVTKKKITASTKALLENGAKVVSELMPW